MKASELLSYFLGQGERLMIDDRRVGVGHREDYRDTSGECSRGARCKIFLVNCSRIAGVHVNVDQAGKLDHRSRGHAICVSFHTGCSTTKHSHSLRNKTRSRCSPLEYVVQFTRTKKRIATHVPIREWRNKLIKISWATIEKRRKRSMASRGKNVNKTITYRKIHCIETSENSHRYF